MIHLKCDYIAAIDNAENSTQITEDYDFINMVQNVVRWSPLTANGKNYRSPYMYYSFYIDALYRFDSFVNLAKDAGAASRAYATVVDFNGKNYHLY